MTKTRIGRKGLTRKTPQWANITFYVLFGLLTSISLWVYSTNLVSENVKPEIQLIITIVTPFFYGLKKALWQAEKEDEPTPNI
jgi:hypothetical protein